MRIICTLFVLVGACVFGENLVIGIAGGSASGKTTLADDLKEIFQDRMVLVSQDCYYKNLSHLPMEERGRRNFDHPDAIEFSLLKEHLFALKRGNPIEIPIYDFATFSRMGTTRLDAAEYIVVEGTLIFAVQEILDECDFKIFIEADDDIRLLRRILRDSAERGYTVKQICDQYLETVKEMHNEFVLPSKKHADLIFPANDPNPDAVQSLADELMKGIA